MITHMKTMNDSQLSFAPGMEKEVAAKQKEERSEKVVQIYWKSEKGNTTELTTQSFWFPT